MSKKTGVIEAAIEAASKMETMKALSEDLEPIVEQEAEAVEVFLDVKEPEIEAPVVKKGRKSSTDDKEAVKTLSVVIPVSDFKRLRVVALSNDRTIKDEIISMIREKYKDALQEMLTPIEE